MTRAELVRSLRALDRSAWVPAIHMPDTGLATIDEQRWTWPTYALAALAAPGASADTHILRAQWQANIAILRGELDGLRSDLSSVVSPRARRRRAIGKWIGRVVFPIVARFVRRTK